MSLFNVFSILMVLAAALAYINYRYLRLPPTIGLMALSLILSVGLVLSGRVYTEPVQWAQALVKQLDFENLLLKVMLGFLLFAGAIHVNLKVLKARLVPILVLASVGILLSTALVGLLTWQMLPLLGLNVPLSHCLVFGALISPTDPIAVLGILKQAAIPKILEVQVTGESLFSDGVAVIVFSTLLGIAQVDAPLSMGAIALNFGQEVFGGALFGALLGYTGFRLMKPINNYQVEVMITLALVMGGYWLAGILHVSGPIALVVAGLITGNDILNNAVDDVTRDYLTKTWEMIDEVLNALLFLLIGLEIVAIKQGWGLLAAGLAASILVLVSRFVSVWVTLLALRLRYAFESGTTRILTWGGLRGGISVAMALSLPEALNREVLLALTYIVVVLSILVQGLSIGPLSKRILKTAA